jgi:hypothetical protein
MVRIQYASDLHINDWPKGTPFESFLTPVAPILVLAGDICSAWDPLFIHFLAWCSRHWYLVVFIAGNHEYYCEPGLERTIQQTEYELMRISSLFPNTKYLQYGTSYIIPSTRIRFVGTTLWSDIDPAIWGAIAGKKGDYKATFVENFPYGIRPTHPSDICAFHAFHKTYLYAGLAPHLPGETVVVITHHMPSKLLLEDKYKGEALHSCYASDAEYLFTRNISLWICGHSHRAIRMKYPRGPYIVMNARGYNRSVELERTEDKYNPRATVELRLKN